MFVFLLLICVIFTVLPGAAQTPLQSEETQDVQPPLESQESEALQSGSERQESEALPPDSESQESEAPPPGSESRESETDGLISGVKGADTAGPDAGSGGCYAAAQKNFSGIELLVNGASFAQVPAGETVTVTADTSGMMPGIGFGGLHVVAADERQIESWYDDASGQYMFIMPECDVAVRPCFFWISLMAADIVGTQHTITNYGEHMNQGLLRVGYFEIDGGTLAWCTQHSLSPPALGTVLTTVQVWGDNQTWLSTMMRRIAWYGYSGPMAETTKAALSLSDSDLWRYTALAFSYAYGSDDNYYGYGKRFVDWLSGVGDDGNAPAGLTVYRLSSGSSVLQDLVYWTYEAAQPLSLRKVSAMPELTRQNPCYRLDGAEYGVYSDEACSQQVGTLVTDEQGNTDEIQLDPGTYYIKELKASEGFALSEDVLQATIEDQPVTVTAKEPPLYDPLGLELTKIDGETGKSEGQGSASLAGAQFTVKYYAGYYTKDDLPLSPTRTWVIETRAVDAPQKERIYFCELSEEYKVSGDAFYQQAGRTILPLGTIAIEETKAPGGYTLEGAYFMQSGKSEKLTGPCVVQIKKNGQGAGLEGGNAYTAVNYPGRGGIGISKADADTGKSEGQGNGHLEGAVYAILSQNEGTIIVDGKSYDKGEEVLRLTTDAKGKAVTASDALPFGNYAIVEVKAPQGYLLNPEEKPFTISQQKTVVTLDSPLTEHVIRGGVKIQKRDADTGNTSAQGNASLAGAVFSVINTSSHAVIVNGTAHAPETVVARLTTDARGIASSSTDLLPYGTYRIVEETAPQGYLKDGKLSVEFAITENGKRVDLTDMEHSITNKVIRGGVMIQKRDIETQDASPQGGATLKGAVFEIINKNREAVYVDGKLVPENEAVARIISNEDGMARTSNDLLPYGDYMLVEVTPPAGYLAQGVIRQPFSVTDNGVIIDLTDESHSILNQVIRGGVQIQKRDLQSGDALPQGNASLEGAVFELINMSRHDVIAGGEIYASGAVICRLTTDEHGLAKTDANFLPFGQYKLVEITPPRGYLGEGVTERAFSVSEDGVLTDLTAPEQSISDQVIRGDFELTKIDADNQNAMADVTFKITSQTTGESHCFTTDANGFYSSAAGWNPHSQNTNGGGAQDGLWFGLDTDGGQTEVDDTLGALPFDTYIIEELRCEANAGRLLYQGTVTISRDGYTVDMGNIENKNAGNPSIATSARCEDTGTAYGPAAKGAAIIDTVTYQDLVVGKVYTLKGELVDGSTGEAILGEDGTPVTAARQFQCVTESGSVELSFTFDASLLGGTDVVVFESLYLEDELVAQHRQLEDEGQTIHFPGIKTSVKSPGNDSHLCGANAGVILVDTVSYTNLEAGKSYTVTGMLMDPENEMPLVIDGREVTASTTFIPEKSDGTVEVVFALDASELGGKRVVVFETLTRGNYIYGEHKDMNDKEQTMYFTEVMTQAADAQSGGHMGHIDSEVTIIDTVTYKNLVPGTKYRLEGRLMDGESGEPLQYEGKTWTEEAAFVAEAADGVIELQFDLPGEAAAGKRIVVFESIYDGETVIGTHADITDENQSVYYPVLKTSASGEVPGNKEIFAGEEVKILDKVTYEGLLPGAQYRLTGSLRSKESGEPLTGKDGQPILREVTLIPDKTCGVVTVEFIVDGTDLAGEEVVVFESLAMDGQVIAEHQSLEDEEQTVRFPQITTAAADIHTGVGLCAANPSVTIVDTLNYVNLTAGKEYRLEGTLMDSSTGSPILADGKAVTAEVIFTPEAGSGVTEIEFSLDATGLEGTSVVVFETLFAGEERVAEHKDIEDEAQTIRFPALKTSAKDSITGGHHGWAATAQVVTVIDEVTYDNLIPGEQYRLEGMLVDSSDGSPIEGNGGEIYRELVFTADQSSGSLTMEFLVPAAAVEGKTVVAFERLFYEDTVIAVHEDLEDEAQSVFYPQVRIRTQAKDQSTGTSVAAAGNPVTLVDEVSYTGLVTGQEYRLEGILMDKASGEPFLVDGDPVTASARFIPGESEGCLELTFTFNAEKLDGRELVVFETLYDKDIEIAAHQDLADEAQTVRIVLPDSPELIAPQTGLQNPLPWAAAATAVLLVSSGIYLITRKHSGSGRIRER